MINNPGTEKHFSAVNDFYRARNQAALKEIIARFSGESVELLSYEDVRQKLRAQVSVERGLQDVPLSAIVGSVGRYTDFTRDFLPRKNTDRDRWAQVNLAVQDQAGLQPIEVYQIGDVYFVIDGNHRVSVARQLGVTYIQAYVTEVRSRVNLTPDVQPDDLILKSEYVSFLEKTRLDELRPNADLSVTAPGKYPILEEHIDVHHYFMGNEQQRDVPYQEAVIDWYDKVFSPVVETIRDSGILRYFPQRTETDLYLWIAKYRLELEEYLGWNIRPETAVVNLATEYTVDGRNLISRVGSKLLNLITPTRLEAGPEPGSWRKDILAARRNDYLFNDILVPIDGKESGWHALSQAALIANRESARLHGLHVTPYESNLDVPLLQQMKDEFQQRCAQSGVDGRLIVVAGNITEEICSRSRWTDLIVTNLLHPPGPQPLDRLDSGFQELIQRCPRPVLATPLQFTPLSRAILAYDGSSKAEEALFIATYIAERWKTSLHVVTVFDNNRIMSETLLRAQIYLEEHGLSASFYPEEGKPADAIIQVASVNQVDLIIMGGYSQRPVIQVVVGSTVDQVLRRSNIPVLICR